MSTIIFNELTTHKTAKHTVTGCEKIIMVRSLIAGGFSLEVSTISKKDPHVRPFVIMTINTSGDYIISDRIACGMDLMFRTDDTTMDPNSHLFVEILYETCIPEKCCPCE